MKVAETCYPELAARHAALHPDIKHPPREALRAVPAISEALINIENLRLRTYIGFNAEEKAKQQDVVINIEIAYAVNPGALEDRVEDALDYKVLTKKVIERVEGGRFLLLEKLTADVLEICSGHPDIHRARVRIDKPHALRFADSVSLTLNYHASNQANISEKGQ